ncbi:hypothetical protein ElyMa_004761500 [Elysia marginata]|uniref:Uncharacterized protein n=1 Tax=Elysia marginata TaxID=1093978 RepID=A0AAV4IIU6_9GAST|nr:hypothetical protein ElyMa_004761500 [Elysia marginata]
MLDRPPSGEISPDIVTMHIISTHHKKKIVRPSFNVAQLTNVSRYKQFAEDLGDRLMFLGPMTGSTTEKLDQFKPRLGKAKVVLQPAPASTARPLDLCQTKGTDLKTVEDFKILPETSPLMELLGDQRQNLKGKSSCRPTASATLEEAKYMYSLFYEYGDI